MRASHGGRARAYLVDVGHALGKHVGCDLVSVLVPERGGLTLRALDLRPRVRCAIIAPRQRPARSSGSSTSTDRVGRS